MKLREKFRRFWTMDVHNHEGFTLVELIIVIAILAILSGVAVVGYSSYVTKANMQADKTLVAEIVNALTLQYYSEQNGDYVASVVLTETGADAAEGSIGEAAMAAAFGTNWRTSLKLSYDKWGSGATATAEVLAHFTNATGATKDIYNGSKHASFEDDTEELFDLVEDTATNIFGADSATSVKAAAGTTMGISATDFAAKWGEYNAWDSANISAGTEYENNVANAAVVKARNTAIAGYVRNNLKDADAEELAELYNMISNWSVGSTVVPEDVVKNLDFLDEVYETFTSFDDLAVSTLIKAYFDTGVAATDGLAYYAMMETVDAVEQDTKDVENYWSSMSDAIDTYASIARGEMDLESIADAYEVLDGVTGPAIIVLFTAEGGTYTITVSPSAVWSN